MRSATHLRWARALLPLAAGCAQGIEPDQNDLDGPASMGGAGSSGGQLGSAGTGGGGLAGSVSKGGSAGSSSGMGAKAGAGGVGGASGASGAGGMGGKAGAGGASGASGASGAGGGGKAGAGGGGGSPGGCASQKLAIVGEAAESIQDAGLPVENATDGNIATRWSSAHSEPQWIYVDLGEVAYVDRVVLIWEVAYGADYNIEIADGSNGPWLSIHHETAGNGATDDLTAFAPAKGRYVRMLGNTRGTQYGFSLFELEVYGDTDENCD